jgi:methyl-accepting chemotaxis protein
MSNPEIPPGDPSRSQRIELLVAHKITRTKRLLWFFSLLLVIPLGAAAFFYRFGRTDIELVDREVKNGIAPIQQIIDQTKPALAQIRQTADQLSAHQTQLNSLSQKQEFLTSTVQALPEKFLHVNASQTSVSLDQQREIDAIKHELSMVNSELKLVQSTNKELVGNMEALSIRIEKVRPINYGEQLRTQQRLINQLSERIESIEKLEAKPPAKLRVAPQK